MKYDRSMTEYDEIVGASIFRLVGKESEKLREANIILSAVSRILKEKHGASYHGCTGEGGISVRSSPSGMETDVGRFFPNIEDRILFLTWSQVAKLILDDDFYKKYVDKHTKPEPQKPSENADDKPAVTTEKSAPITSFDYSELAADESDKLRKIELTIKTETASYFTILGANFKAAQELLANHSGGTFERWYTSLGFKRQTVYNLIQRHDFFCSPTVGEQKADVFEGLPLKLSYEISKPSAPPELVAKVLDGDITSHAEYRKLKKDLEEAEQREKKLKTDLELCRTNLLNVECNFEEREKLRMEVGKENTQLRLKIKELESRPVEVAVEKREVIPEGYVSPEEHRNALEELEKRSKQLSDEIMRLKVSQNAEKTGKLSAQIAELEQQLKDQQNETTKAYGKASKAAYDSEMKGKALEEAQQKNAELEKQLAELKQAEQTDPDISEKLFRIHKRSVTSALTGFVVFAVAPENKAYRAKAIEVLESYLKSLKEG